MYLFLQVVFQQNSPGVLTSTGILPRDGHCKQPRVRADSLGKGLGEGEML